MLDEGQISLDVVKQPRNKSVTISTPDVQVTVVGTALDVQVLTKPNGRKQTWVDVRSGRVELASGGKRVVLLPNMQGVANQGEPPMARSQTAEVNELARLVERTAVLAAKAGTPPGRPAIVEFSGDGSETVWSLIEIRNAAGTDLNESFLECSVPDGGLDVFSLQGARLPVTARVSGGGSIGRLIPCRRVDGAFWSFEWATCGGCLPRSAGVNSSFPARPRPAGVSLLQLRLPSSARVEAMEPKPVEVRRSLSRLVLTILASYQLPQVVRELPCQGP